MCQENVRKLKSEEKSKNKLDLGKRFKRSGLGWGKEKDRGVKE